MSAHHVSACSALRDATALELHSVTGGGIVDAVVGWIVGKVLDEVVNGQGFMGAYCTAVKNNGGSSPACPQ